ncbi:hypothetical protein ABS648_03400 [Pseudomonas solani]|uniref:Uncharacterized protein n=1 Tax=Pseudomonas solani TaxID=2731552 RepID=A0AAU7Y4X8_9PSED
MARRIAYIGPPVLTLEDVARQCRIEPQDLERALIEGVIIPGVTTQAESKTGAAIRPAEYVDEWPESYGSGHTLDVGQAFEVVEVRRVLLDGSTEPITEPTRLQREQLQSYLHFPRGRPPGVLQVRYKAGVDLEANPGVRLWLLMHAATAHEYRETMVAGTILAQLPGSFLDSMLDSITVPPRF